MTKIDKNSLLKDRLERVNAFDGNLIMGAKKFHGDTKRTGESRPSSGGITPEHSKVVIDTKINRYQHKDGLWEEVTNCLVCNSSGQKWVFDRMGLNIVECITCGHGFLNPRIKFDVATQIYGDDKTASDIYTSPVQIEIDEKKYDYGLDVIDEFRDFSKKGRILDIGCGSGLFLDRANNGGWRKCVGVDINERYQSGYQDIDGVQFIMSTFEDLSPQVVGSDYQSISMWGVLEHIYDPKAVLSKVRSLLSDDGNVLILVPNYKSLATRIIREKSPTFNWKHVSYFSPESLQNLMKKAGFKTVHMETVISEIDNVKSYLSGKEPYYGHGDPDNLFDFITPEYIHQNMLGSRILGLFEKVI